MITIDSFLTIPFLVSAGIALLLFVFLLISKIRNTTPVSFIFLVICVVVIAGSFYSLLQQAYMYYVVTIVITELLAFPIVFLKAISNPKKKEQKLEQKKLSDAQNKDTDTVTKEALMALENKYEKLMEVNNHLVGELGKFFSSENPDIENYLKYCNTLITERVHADGCMFLIADDNDNALAVKSFEGKFPPPYKLPDDLPHKPVRVETSMRYASYPLQDNIFGEIFKTGEAVYIPDSIKDHRVYQNGPEEFLRTGGFIFVPLKQDEATVGLIALSKNPGEEKFSKEDFESAKILADSISITLAPLYAFLSYAEQTELNKGGSIATQYQKELLPPKMPANPLASMPNLTLGCFTNQIANVCGDYYDVIATRKDKISFVMADIAGKGMNSLIVMIMLRAILKLAANTDQSAATVMAWANHGICLETAKIDHFASVAFITYNSTAKEVKIAACGNNAVFHYKAEDKSFTQITEYSEPMGVSRDTKFGDITVKVNSGDIICTCTDGLLECLNENGVQYGSENLKKLIIKNSNNNAKDISTRVKDDVKKYCGAVQQHDDQSFLVIKFQ